MVVDVVELSNLVGRAVRRSFGARAIVAADEDDQCVVELADVLHCLDDATDLMVGVGEIRGICVDLADEQLLLVRAQSIPFLQFVGPRRQLSVRRDYAELFFWLAKI